ncbi:MAG: sugar phosphate isomerase/epimerase, partial [Clostridia bacterium]|nr:sugar phosphate isomerase/epimerase [Clostridia bacterium]
MEIGVIIGLNEHLEQKLEKLFELGFSSCQLSCWEPEMYTDENAVRITSLLQRYGIRISTLWCGWSGPKQWNFTEGPLTLGLVPKAYRQTRTAQLLAGSDFARKLGVGQIATHVGFIPEDPNDGQYGEIVSAVRTVALRCAENGQYFLFETGQETPTTLLRTIQDVGLDNVGVNLDPANLILYGKANPVDALGVIGKYVRDVHAKDGCYPTDG